MFTKIQCQLKKKKRWGEKEGEVPIQQSEEHVVLG